ncbi:MAG: type IV pilus modification protein PilV [Pseudomonadota bacterium]
MLIIRKDQRGVTMLEVLVTVAILAIGLLGVAGLQVQALRSTKVSFERSVILEHSSRIMEAIRANPDIAESFDINSNALPGTAPGCTTTCTDVQRAQIDLVAIRDSLQASLNNFNPSWTVTIAPVVGADPPFEVDLTLQWETRNDAGNGTDVFTYNTVSQI